MNRLSSCIHAVVLTTAALALGAQQAGAQRVAWQRVGYRFTFIGMRVAAEARVVDDAGRAVANAPIVYHMGDPTIASVTPGGEIIARRNGDTKLWAVSGKDSSAALIKVEQAASRFAFTPVTIRLDAIGARQSLKVLASDAGGIPVAGGTAKTASCRSVNSRVASFSSTGNVLAVSNGSTFIRCADRGIADSIRVDVQQRVVSVGILNKAGLSRKQFGDTFSIRIQARDPQGNEVVDGRPSWASLNSQAVSVDPLTGKARAVNNGESKILVQIGDIADSTTIAVTGSPLFQALPTAVATTDSTTTTTSKASVSTQDIYMYLQDTAIVSVVATDSSGAAVPASRVKVRLSDPSVAHLVDSSTRVFGAKLGQTSITVEYGSRTDTKNVFVRPKTADTGNSSTGSAARDSLPFTPPTDSSKVLLPAYQARRDSVLRVIATDPKLALANRNLIITAGFYGSIAEHLSRADSAIIEDRTGPLIGAGGTVSLYQKVELGGTFRTGTLQSTGLVGEDLTLAEIEGSAAVFPVKQIGLRAGYLLRSEKTRSSTQYWAVPKVSLLTRFTLIGDIFHPFATFTIMPKAQYSDKSLTPSLLCLSGETGLDMHISWANLGLSYYVEQFKFDNSPRVEDFSAIRFRIAAQPW